MSRRRCAWALPWLLGGCAVDLWVGDRAGAESSGGTTAAGEAEGSTTIVPPADDTSVSTTTGPGLEEEGSPTTGPVEEEGPSSSTGPVEEEGSMTSGELACEGLGMLDCNELEYCLWYGDGEGAGCLPSPCANPKHDCWAFGLEACEAAFACAWVATEEPGECAPIECVPCELLTADQCAEAPTCTWDEGEVFCFPA